MLSVTGGRRNAAKATPTKDRIQAAAWNLACNLPSSDASAADIALGAPNDGQTQSAIDVQIEKCRAYREGGYLGPRMGPTRCNAKQIYRPRQMNRVAGQLPIAHMRLTPWVIT